MLTPFDDYPIHQTALPLAHPVDADPNRYDRFWFNGYREHFYFAVALGVYPNREVIDAAFSTVYDGVQRSVFASGRLPADRSITRIGPLEIEIVEPMRVNRVIVNAPSHGLEADVEFTTRTAAYEEPRQTRWAGHRLLMDVTRATQLGKWSGTVRTGSDSLSLAGIYGTKDRSWGVRPVGDPAPAAPASTLPQLFFLWAPLNFDQRALHYMVFEDSEGRPWSETAAVLHVAGGAEPTLTRIAHEIQWEPGLRRSRSARLHLSPSGDVVELSPTLTFRMKGAGYLHPVWSHGRWQGESAVAGEEHRVEDLDTTDFDCLHVQQVVRAKWGPEHGLGVLEQLVIGPHAPFKNLNDGAPG